MNIAFVCTGEFEPFLYDCIARRLEQDGIRVFYCAFFMDSRNAIRRIKRDCYPTRGRCVLRSNGQSLFTEGELNQIIQYDYLRLRTNKEKIKKERLIDKALCYEDFFRDFYNKHAINAVIVWNYFPVMANVAWRVARKIGIQQIFFENGTLPHTLMIDTEGVNYQISLTKNKKDFYEKIKIDAVLWDPYVLEYKTQKNTIYIKNKGIMTPWGKFYYALLMRNFFYKNTYPDLTDDTTIQSIYKKLYARFLIKEETVALPEHFIFLPLQHSCDSQVLVNSPAINNMDKFIRSCYKSIRDVLPSNYKIIVKEHPDDWGRIDYGRLKKQYPDIIWLRKYPIKKLMEKTDLVITVNSSVGVQSLLFHKPVITLGRTFYNVEGLVYHVEDLGILPEVIKAVLKKPVNEELIDKFLYYLRFEYLVKGSPMYCDEEILTGAYERVKKILTGS